MNLILHLFGGKKITVKPAESLWVINTCYRFHLSVKGLHKIADGGLILFCKNREAKILQGEAAKTGHLLEMQSVGLPSVFLRYRRRYGLAAGTVFGIFLLAFSSRFLWNISVEGNESMTDTELRELFADCGLSVGSAISGIDGPALENRILLETDRLSWVSVTLEGTVAKVQVIEATTPTPKEPLQPANLIATADGEITLFRLYRGMPAVAIGDAVRAGDLLVSGIYESPTAGVLFTRSAGEVLAKTDRELRVEIPISQTERSLQNRKIEEISLTFFGKTLKFFKRCGNTDGFCDIIKENIFRLSDWPYPIPVRIDVVWQENYAENKVRISAESVEQMANEQMERKLSDLSDEIEILEKTFFVESNEEKYCLVCKLSCIENIAKQTEFEIE